MCVKDVPDLHRYVVADSLNDCDYTWKILFGTTNLKIVSEKEMLKFWGGGVTKNSLRVYPDFYQGKP